MFRKTLFSPKKKIEETFFGLRSREKLSAGRPLKSLICKNKSYNPLYITAEFNNISAS